MLGRGAAAAVAIALLVVGCSDGEAKPKVLPTLGTPSPTAEPIVIPLAARPATAQGADAFVRFYFDVLNEAFSTSNPAAIRSLSDKQCATCENYAKALDDGDDFIKGESFSRLDVAAMPVTMQGSVVDVFGVIPARQVLDSKGRVVKELKADGRFHFQVKVERRATSWVVRGIRLAT